MKNFRLRAAQLPLFLRFRQLALITPILLSGCMSGPDFQRPHNPLTEVTLHPRSVSVQTAELREETVPVEWWQLFNDALLSDLQARALHGNLDLQAASARIAQSRAQLGVASAALWPTIGIGADYAREAISANGPIARLGAPSAPHNLWQTVVDASWEIDFWGRAARARESALAASEARVYEREAMRVSLTAEIARDYLLLRTVQTQLDIAGQNLAIAKHAVRLTHSREQNGVATRFDTASARAQQASVEALIPAMTQQRNTLMNSLALLLGEAPRRLDAELLPALPVPDLPRKIPVGLPLELAMRRPDIREAQARLHEATAAIGVAEADFYPRISLTGSLGLQAFDRNDMGNWSSRNFSVGPTLYLPIFEGGRLKSTLALSHAVQQSAAIAYQQTVLQAWHEIDDALNALDAEQQRHQALQTAFEQNREAFEVARRAYQQGAGDYLSVLIAQRNLLNSQMTLADSSTAASLALVSLYKALGGGWNPTETQDAETENPPPAPGDAEKTRISSLQSRNRNASLSRESS